MDSQKFTYYTTERFIPEYFEKELTLELEKETIRAKAISEDCVFYDDAGNPEASIFMQSYLRETEEASDRPVLFCWNGGPGSASSTLQLECFGPYLIDRKEDGSYGKGVHVDPACVLDHTDLVYIDQVGVGYSRLIRKDLAEKYYSVDADARCYAFAVMRWLKNHKRLMSPVYFCGESYGTVRACRVVAELGRSPMSESRMVPGLPPRGVILVGNATSMAGDGSMLEKGLELTAAMMPAMAAVNWYHNHEKKEDLRNLTREDFVERAWKFAGSDLISAYFRGEGLSQKDREHTAHQLEYYTGVSAQYYLAHDLRMASPEDFMTNVLAGEGKGVDIYDGRLTWKLAEGYNPIGSSDNRPLKVMNTVMAELRGIKSDRLYFTGNLTGNMYWNMDTEDVPGKKSHIACLRDAMIANPEMKVLFASGLYDLCTHAGNTRYQLSHSRMPMERVESKEYPGGHGVYSTAEGKEQFLEDVRGFVQ